jgi:hypothetical protein
LAPAQVRNFLDHGWSLDIEVTSSSAANTVSLEGVLDTGASILVIDDQCKQDFIDAGVIPDDGTDDGKMPVNGEQKPFWLVDFSCPRHGFSSMVAAVFSPLQSRGFVQKALVGRGCLTGATFTYSGPHEQVDFH